MGIGVRSNIAEFDKAMDAFASDVEQVAAPRILNKLQDQAQTAGFRKVAEIYDVPARTMAQYSRVKIATQADVRAILTVAGRGFPLSALQPRQTRAGVSFKVKGRRVLFPHAFMQARFGSHVFARGTYGKQSIRPTGQSLGRFRFGRSRLPIHEIFSFGPVEAIENAEVAAAMSDRIEEQAAKVAAQELRFAAR